MAADCPSTQPVTPVLTGQGSMESIVTGPDRKLYFTVSGRKALVRLAARNAEPELVTDGVEAPGGLVPGLDGRSVLLGYGDSLAGGALGNLAPQAGILRVDLQTGEKTTVATGTRMSNGLARDADGRLYASTDVGASIDRVVDGKVQNSWATLVSPNGLAVDRASRYLYAAQTFQPAQVSRIALDDPTDVTVFAAPGPADLAAGLDGMTIDGEGNLYVAANQGGEVWRIDADDGAICALARGLEQPSAVAFGEGGPFAFASLFVVGFGGELSEIPGARANVPLRVRVRRRHHRLTVRVTRDGRPVAAVPVRVRGRLRGQTNVRGVLRLRVKKTPRAVRVGPRRIKLR